MIVHCVANIPTAARITDRRVLYLRGEGTSARRDVDDAIGLAPGGGAAKLYSLQSVLRRRRALARGPWPQCVVRHQLPVQLDNGLTAPKFRPDPTSVPTPLTPYRVSSVVVPSGIVNLTIPNFISVGVSQM